MLNKISFQKITQNKTKSVFMNGLKTIEHVNLGHASISLKKLN